VAVNRTTPLSTRLLLAGLGALSQATRVVPRHEVGEPLCRLAGVVWYLAAPAARAAVRDNLRHVFGRQPTRRKVVAVFQFGALNYWDTFAIPHFSHAGILRLLEIHGVEAIEQARAAGKGVIVISAHLGSVAFVGQILPALGYPTIGLLEPLDPPELYEFFARQRQALGARLLPAGTAALREVLRALRRNEVVGLVTDRDVTGSGPSIPFFDAPTQFPDGAAALSIRTGAPIVIAVSIRRRDGRFDVWIEPLPDVPRTSGDTRRDVLTLTQAVARGLQYHIASHPEQWTVFQKRWPEAQPG
jgi:phosphatidylinositol dimannoside acyltransferase